MEHGIWKHGRTCHYRSARLLCTAVVVFMACSRISANPPPHSSDDLLALIAFKSGLRDPLDALVSWNNSLHFCKWHGVECGGGGGGRRFTTRVTALQLDSFNLSGNISPEVGNLTYLSNLHLSNNQLTGPIPEELNRLSRLRSLNLSFNFLSGDIPTNLSRCQRLQDLNLGNNMLSGMIPPELGLLSELQILNLVGNTFSGGIPPELGNLSSLVGLLLYDVSVKGGIPESFGKLSKLKILQIGLNNLSGEISSSIFNITSIEYFTAGQNRLSGKLPHNMFDKIPNIKMLIFDDNDFQGSIPASLPNASKLGELDLKNNNFNGRIPRDLGRLKNLYWLNLDSNSLRNEDAVGWEFLDSLTNCTSLETLGLSNNMLSGVLPGSIANLSAHLDLLAIGENQIAGQIPESIGRLQKLGILAILDNNFDGGIPFSVGNLTQLNKVDLRASGLGGNITVSAGNWKELEFLDLSQNKFSGFLPKELFKITSLSIGLVLSNNGFTGRLPEEVGELRNLAMLDVSANELSGPVPNTIGDCESLEYLYMQHNSFQGSIPLSLGNLKGIAELNLSSNNLSGEIPEQLASLHSLLVLDISFNDLEGKVPGDGVFRNVTAVSLAGNKKLCGGASAFELPNCTLKVPERGRNRSSSRVLKVAIPIAACAGMSVILLVGFLAWNKRNSNNEKPPPPPPPSCREMKRVTYRDIQRATNNFSPSNLIGQGAFGSVYKGTLKGEDDVVAVKVLKLDRNGASRSFAAECEAWKKIRHRNLVKVIASCSSVDQRGEDFKALVLQFMPNGNLDQCLHRSSSELLDIPNLNFLQRLNIAIDVASAMDYLHSDCWPPIVHCDLKPSNVLLDGEMHACVGDFGLARSLSAAAGEEEDEASSSNRIRGTIGYVAPEYGIGGRISIEADVYSFGILLLEIFTGKRPTDGDFDGVGSLRSYTEMAMPDRVMEIADPTMFFSVRDYDGDQTIGENTGGATNDDRSCLASAIEIGISCSCENPKSRLSMRIAVRELSRIKDTLAAGGDWRRTPGIP